MVPPFHISDIPDIRWQARAAALRSIGVLPTYTLDISVPDATSGMEDVDDPPISISTSSKLPTSGTSRRRRPSDQYRAQFAKMFFLTNPRTQNLLLIHKKSGLAETNTKTSSKQRRTPGPTGGQGRVGYVKGRSLDKMESELNHVTRTDVSALVLTFPFFSFLSFSFLFYFYILTLLLSLPWWDLASLARRKEAGRGHGERVQPCDSQRCLSSCFDLLFSFLSFPFLFYFYILTLLLPLPWWDLASLVHREEAGGERGKEWR